MKEMIQQLLDERLLSTKEAYDVMSTIMSGEATDAQIAGYLIALRMRGETAEVIAGSVKAMREKCTPVDKPDSWVVDTCGTGGDGQHTFNISTAAALVTAGAGVPVAKHGNRSVSSRSGSADVLTALGVNIAIEPERMAHCLHQIGIAFLFAPSLHPAMKYAIGPRKELGVRTLFNILGPLSNPAGTERGVLGVYAESLVPLVAEATRQLGAKHLFVVHGLDGLDEITTTTATRIAEVRDGELMDYRVQPEDFGIPRAHPEDLRGEGPEENADIIRSILDGEQGPKTDIVCINAAAALVAGGKAADLANGFEVAKTSIQSGAAKQKLEQLIAMTS